MTRTSRSGIGKLGAALVVVAMVGIVVGVGSFFASQGPPEKLSAQQIMSMELASSSANQYSSGASTTQATCSEAGAVNVTVGSSSPPCGCALVDSNSDGSLYISPNPKVGDNVCIQATLRSSSEVELKVTNSTGSLMFSDQCAATGGGQSSGDTCLSLWDTAAPDPRGNPIEPGTYHVVATGSSAAVQLEANLTLS